MKSLLTLVLIGFAAYGGYTWWNKEGSARWNKPHGQEEPGSSPQRTPAVEPRGPAAPPASSSIPKDATADLVQATVMFTHENMEQILSPIRGAESRTFQITPLKIRLITESRRIHGARSTVQLQTALQLLGVLEQAVTQRGELARLLHAREYAEGIEGTSSASNKNFQLSPEEERMRIGRTEWWKRGTEHKWDESALLYRSKIEKLLVALAN